LDKQNSGLPILHTVIRHSHTFLKPQLVVSDAVCIYIIYRRCLTMSVKIGRLWHDNLQRKDQALANLGKCHFVHHKSHTGVSGNNRYLLFGKFG